MKDSRKEVIIRFLCKKTNTKALKKGMKQLYYLFLHEDFYSIILSQKNSKEQNQNNFVVTKNPIQISHGYYGKTFLDMKRIIMLLRSNESFYKQRCFLNKSFKQKKNRIFQNFLESIVFLLLLTYEKSVTERKKISISIHKPLEYIEKHWQYHSFGFQGKIYHYFHPEIILRILRKKIKDISFLHLIRIFLHIDLYSVESTLKEKFLKKVITILWNIYALEIDNFFLSDLKDYYVSEKGKYTSINEWLSCLQKFKEWKSFLQKKKYRAFFSKNFKKNLIKFSRRNFSFLEISSTYKYLRTNTVWFLFFYKKKPWSFLIYIRIRRFFSQRLGYVFQVNRINPILAQTSYFFLAYILQFTKKKNIVKINTKFFFLKNFVVINYISFLNPFFLIINVLAKQNFCSSFGYPKSKSGWVTWTDIQILEYFHSIRNTFFLFYSGCNNSKALYRIQYILHYSCAKTLACKHKTNLRKISKLTHFYKNQKIIRLWNFQLKQMDSIIFF